jgi:hypothetical protein
VLVRLHFLSTELLFDVPAASVGYSVGQMVRPEVQSWGENVTADPITGLSCRRHGICPGGWDHHLHTVR